MNLFEDQREREREIITIRIRERERKKEPEAIGWKGEKKNCLACKTREGLYCIVDGIR